MGTAGCVVNSGPAWSAEWPVIVKSKKDAYHAFCTVCSSDFLVKYGGRNDVDTHVTGDKHKATASSRSSTSTLSNFFVRSDSNDVIKAEVSFTGFLIEHNLPISAAVLYEGKNFW